MNVDWKARHPKQNPSPGPSDHVCRAWDCPIPPPHLHPSSPQSVLSLLQHLMAEKNPYPWWTGCVSLIHGDMRLWLCVRLSCDTEGVESCASLPLTGEPTFLLLHTCLNKLQQQVWYLLRCIFGRLVTWHWFHKKTGKLTFSNVWQRWIMVIVVGRSVFATQIFYYILQTWKLASVSCLATPWIPKVSFSVLEDIPFWQIHRK